MRKITLMLIALIIFTGCSENAVHWPKKVSGTDFYAERLEPPYSTAQEDNRMLHFSVRTQKEVIAKSSLIAKLEITEEQILYRIDCLFHGEKSSQLVSAFKAKIIKVYYTDASEQDGDIIKLIREEYWEDESQTILYTDPQITKITPGTYVLYLESFNAVKQRENQISSQYGISNFYTACEAIAPYQCNGLNESIFLCSSDQIDSFDENIQAMINQFKQQ